MESKSSSCSSSSSSSSLSCSFCLKIVSAEYVECSNCLSAACKQCALYRPHCPTCKECMYSEHRFMDVTCSTLCSNTIMPVAEFEVHEQECDICKTRFDLNAERLKNTKLKMKLELRTADSKELIQEKLKNANLKMELDSYAAEVNMLRRKLNDLSDLNEEETNKKRKF